MSKMQECHVAEAQRMRLAGHSWRMIGRAFGVKEDTVQAAVDPIYAERRRQWLRDSRARTGRVNERRVIPIKVLPRRVGEVWPLKSVEGRELGIRAITLKQVPASNPLGPRTAEIVPVSLPYLHFLYGGENMQIVEKTKCV